MATTIDSLMIDITAKCKNADNISRLADSVQKLAYASNTVKTNNLSSLATSINNMRIAKSSVNNITQLASALRSLSKVNLNTTSLNKFVTSLGALSGASRDINSVKNLVAEVSKLGSTPMNIDTTQFDTLAKSIATLVSSINQSGGVSSSVAKLVDGLSGLANAGAYIGTVVERFPLLSTQLISFTRQMAQVKGLDSNVAILVTGLGRLASAGNRTGQTASQLHTLGQAVYDLLVKLSQAPEINSNIASTIQGLGNIATASNNVRFASNNIASGTSNMSGNFKSLVSRLNDVRKNALNVKNVYHQLSSSTVIVARKIGMFYVKWGLLIRGFRSVGKAVGSAQDYIESFNYFAVAMTKVANDSKKQFAKSGKTNAEEYVSNFRKRYSDINQKMTGANVNYDTGSTEFAISKNLGLNIKELLQYEAQVTQLTNSVGMLGKTSTNTAEALTMLAGDWSSLANEDLATTMQHLQSGLIGQARAVYRYGIDITTASLGQTALAHSVTKSVSEMTQQEKMQLRVLTMLENSKVAYGDLARTIDLLVA